MSRRRMIQRLSICALAAGLAACQYPQLSWEDLIDAGHEARLHGQHADAEELLLEALARADRFPPDDVRRVTTLAALAELADAQLRPDEAETLYRQALAAAEQALGPAHLDLAPLLITLAELYAGQGLHAEAAPYYERAVALLEASLGRYHLDVANALAGLASAYYLQGYHAEAAPLYERSLEVFEVMLEPDNVRLADTLAEYAGVLRATGRDIEAVGIERRVLTLRSAP
ncbi:MAG: tetratricopeptide repeat protein [Acidobacteria bacterium]|nr:tetratricopeptide repeat protein [Acidobacteriota bacterium]